MPSAAVPAKCDECDANGVIVCTGCRSSNYCSAACQQKARPTHDVLCKTFCNFQIRPQRRSPAQKWIRAILFHPDEKAPRFIWLRTEIIIDRVERWLKTFPEEAIGSISSLPGAPTRVPFYGNIEIRDNLALNRKLPHPLFALHNVHGRRTERVSRSASSIINKQSRFATKWRGPLIIYSKKWFEPELDVDLVESKGVDATPADIRPVQHWLDTFRFKELRMPNDSLITLSTEIACVRANCLADQEIHGRPRFESISLPAYHVAFGGDLVPVSKQVGFPILAKKVLKDMKKWSDHGVDFSCALLRNPAVSTLMKGSIADNGFLQTQKIGTKFDEAVGSVVFVRDDRKPLLPAELEALHDFASQKLVSVFDHAEQNDLGTDYILREINKPRFNKYYDEWKENQSDQDAQTEVGPAQF